MTIKRLQGAGVGLMVAVVSAAGLAGCQSVDPAVQRSQQATDVLVQTRQSLGDEEKVIADAQKSLQTLRDTQGDLRPSFAAFSTQLDAVRKQADRLKLESDRVRAQAELYCAARQSDVSTIANQDMRRSAELRATRMREQCDTVKEHYSQVGDALAAYIRNLNDLQTYLANELTYPSLQAGQRWVDEALASGERLRGHIRGLALQVELTSNILSPVPIAATRWPDMPLPTDAMAEQH